MENAAGQRREGLSVHSLRLVSDTRWETSRLNWLTTQLPVQPIVEGTDSLLAAFMMIDLNGPDMEAVDDVKALILESGNAWKNYKKRMPSRSRAA